MTFFTDENFIYKANALLEAFESEHSIRALLDQFDRGTFDTVWIPAIAKWEPTPFVISGDGRVLRDKVERRVLKESGLTYFLMASGWTNTKWPEYAWRLLRVWPAITAAASQVTRPTIFEVPIGKATVRRLPNL